MSTLEYCWGQLRFIVANGHEFVHRINQLDFITNSTSDGDEQVGAVLIIVAEVIDRFC